MLKRRLLLYITFAGFLVGCNKVYPPKGAIYSESPPERIKQIDAVIDNHIGNFQDARHQKHKGEKQKTDGERRQHFLENVAAYDGVEFHIFAVIAFIGLNFNSFCNGAV